MVKIICPSYQIMSIDGVQAIKNLELIGRTCYKSEDKITEDSAKSFVEMLLNRGHESVIEHITMSVRIICDRGVTHEIVRHRLCSYSQESTRYCNYAKDKFGKEITVIDPGNYFKDHRAKACWMTAMNVAEQCYLQLIDVGESPQMARSVLPNSLKTEIVVTANLREWRHIFNLRCSKAAHPQMREIMIPLHKEAKKRIPIVFDDIEYEE